MTRCYWPSRCFCSVLHDIVSILYVHIRPEGLSFDAERDLLVIAVCCFELVICLNSLETCNLKFDLKDLFLELFYLNTMLIVERRVPLILI